MSYFPLSDLNKIQRAQHRVLIKLGKLIRSENERRQKRLKPRLSPQAFEAAYDAFTKLQGIMQRNASLIRSLGGTPYNG